MKYLRCWVIICVAMAAPAFAIENLLTNPGFLDTSVPADGAFGDGWGSFGTVGFNEFFGPGNPHASLFADIPNNGGGFFQQGIPGTPGTTYQFDLVNTRIEENFDGDLRFGVEFYEADDATKVGETIVSADTATRIANGTLDGNVFSMQATAPAGTVIARPIVLFGPAPFPGSANQEQVFVFNSHFAEIPSPGGELLKNPGFEDLDGQGDFGDFWNTFGAAGFGDDFSGGGDPNGHATLFAETPNNDGGFFQQGILGAEGDEFEFALTDVRIEENYDAPLSFGLEYYEQDDFTKIGETIVSIDTSTGMVDGNLFVMQGTAPAGTTYVRPIVSYGPSPFPGSVDQERIQIFDASLVQLSTTVENADFDSDTDVDGTDFLTWQRGNGSAGGLAQGDANNNGFVDGDDLAIWESQYAGGTLIAFAAVPEPSSLSLMLLGTLSLVRRTGRAGRG